MSYRSHYEAKTFNRHEPLPLIRAKQEENVVVEVATICKGNATKHLANLRRLVTSMMDQSAGSKIRLTILSDPDSWPSANEALRNAIGHYYAKGEKSTLMLFVNKCRPLPLRNTKMPKEEYARDLISYNCIFFFTSPTSQE